MMKDATTPVVTEPTAIPSFADSSSIPSPKASVAMKRDIVKPMPPSHAQPCKIRHETCSGSVAHPSATLA